MINTYRVFKGDKQIGNAKVELPKIELASEGHSEAGVLGEIEMAITGHTKPYKLKIDFTDLEVEQFELYDPKGIDLSFRGSRQNKDGTTTPIKAVTKAKMLVLDPGSLENAKKMGTAQEFTTEYYQLTVGSKVVFEHDKINMVYLVNGVDHLANIRKDIGL